MKTGFTLWSHKCLRPAVGCLGMSVRSFLIRLCSFGEREGVRNKQDLQKQIPLVPIESLIPHSHFIEYHPQSPIIHSHTCKNISEALYCRVQLSVVSFQYPAQNYQASCCLWHPARCSQVSGPRGQWPCDDGGAWHPRKFWVPLFFQKQRKGCSLPFERRVKEAKSVEVGDGTTPGCKGFILRCLVFRHQECGHLVVISLPSRILLSSGDDPCSGPIGTLCTPGPDTFFHFDDLQ